MMDMDSIGGADAAMARGRRLLAQNRPQDAKTIFARILAGNRKHRPAWAGLGDAAAKMQAHSEAIDAYRRAAHRRPDDIRLNLRMAHALLALALFDEAGRCYETVLAQDPAHLRALIGCGRVARHRGDHERTLSAYQGALAIQPDNLQFALRVAEAQLALGQSEAAEAGFRSILAREPDHAAVLVGLGDAARNQGRLAEAAGHFERALARKPGSSRAGTRAATVLRTLGENDRARAALGAVLAVHPEDPAALLMLGEMMLKSNRRDEGQVALQRAATAAPGKARGWARFARSADTAGEAFAILDEADAAIGAHPVLALARIHLLFRRGRDREGQALLDDALKRFPADLALRHRAIKADVIAGRFAAAEAALPNLPIDTPRRHAAKMMLVAQLADRRRRIDDAATAFEAAVAVSPGHVPALLGLARMNVLRMRATDAYANLNAACSNNRGALLLRGKSLNASQSLTGEFANDLRSNPQALAAGRAALDRRDVDGLLSVVRAEPDHTGTAIGLLVLLRQQGALDDKPAAAPEPRQIPRRFFQFWNDPMPPPDVAELMDSWQTLNPGWTCMRYSDETARAYLSQYGDLLVYRAWRSARRIAQRADLFRLAVLAQDGGVYADADDRCVGNLDAVTARGSLLLWHEILGSTGNNFIAAAPGHPLILKALSRAASAILRGDSESIWLSTGPGLLTRCLARYLAAEPARLHSLGRDIRILEPHELRAVCVAGCQAAYKTGNRHWLRSEFAQSKPDAGQKQA